MGGADKGGDAARLAIGSDQFVERMSKSVGRDLKVRPPGRSRKERPVGAGQINGR
jgi:hypothetical protein